MPSAPQKKLSTGLKVGIIIGAVVIVGLIVAVIVLGTSLHENNAPTQTATTAQTTAQVSTQAPTTQVPETTTETTTLNRPSEVPNAESYLLYIDTRNQTAWTVLGWKSVSGTFDGYEIQFGFRADEGKMTEERWADTYTVSPSETSYRTELEYATDSGFDMARVRTFYTLESGETVYGEWSNTCLLDYENKIIYE